MCTTCKAHGACVCVRVCVCVCVVLFSRKPRRGNTLGGPMRNLVNDIKTNLKETVYKSVSK
jgi:hypothetical protein